MDDILICESEKARLRLLYCASQFFSCVAIKLSSTYFMLLLTDMHPICVHIDIITEIQVIEVYATSYTMILEIIIIVAEKSNMPKFCQTIRL